MPEINIEAEEPGTLPVTLVGKKYSIVPPKTALAMKMAVQSKVFADDPEKMKEVLDAWINRAFGDKAEKIYARLDDPKDLLDLDHIMALMERVVEVQMEDTPTS